MKSKVVKLALFLVLFFSNYLLGQIKWEWKNPLPQGNLLESVQTIDANNVVAVGIAGTFMKSTDGGINWTIKHNLEGHSSIFYSVFFLNKNIGWIVGDDGIIIKTNDGGINWIKQNSGVNNTMFTVHFVDENNGWIAGGKIFKTTDGGNTWIQITTPTVGGDNILYACRFFDKNNGIACGEYEGILKTSDGGITWDKIMGGAYSLYSISIVNSTTGWIVGDQGTIYKTSDSGETWSKQSITAWNLWSVSFIDDKIGWISEGGNALSKIFKTTDGGVSWVNQSYPNTCSLVAINFFDINNGWLVGHQGRIFKTTNGGSEWIDQSTGHRGGLQAVKFANPQTGWIVGYYGTILKTSDFGNTWVTQRTSLFPDLIKSLFVFDVNNVWASSYQTSDGGTTWTESSHSTAQSIYFVNQNVGWTISGRLVSQTTDRGTSWTVSSAPSSNLLDVFFINEQTGWVVGEGSVPDRLAKVFKSTDGGKTFVEQIITDLILAKSKSLTSVKFIDSQNGWAVGEEGTIIKTTNGGINWQQIGGNPIISQWLITTVDLNEIFVIDKNNLWIAGDYGTVLFTTDGGNTWHIDLSITFNYFSGLYFIDPNTAIFVGGGGTILKADISNLTSVPKTKDVIATQYKLEQNYPNPFNPNTLIKYSVSQTCHITLTVFDLLGREVITLIDEEKNPGNYEVEFKDNNYASGIYFYKLRTNKFTETKKMLLLK
jgi:photosystem II stability/assembly factor-like uncharacterized protein